MKNAAMNFRSMPSSLRRILTLLVVFAVVLVTLPVQANAQEWTTTSTTAYDTADEDDWATESTSEPVEQPSATSKASKTSAAHPDDYTEDPALAKEAIEPFDETAEPELATEIGGADELSGESSETVTIEINHSEAGTLGVQSLRSAFGMFSRTGSNYDPQPGPGVQNFWVTKRNESHARVKNPEIQPRCGLNVALVFDVSNSIKNIGGLENSRQAGRTIIDILEGSAGTNLGIFSFETFAKEIASSIDMETNADEARRAIERLSIAPFNIGGTNWEAALKQVSNSRQKYDIVYFITDGVPTTSNDTNVKGRSAVFDEGNVPHNNDIANAVEAAEVLKEKGARLELITIGLDDETTYTVLRDDVASVAPGGIDDLGSFTKIDNYTWQLNDNNPNYKYGSLNKDWVSDAVGLGGMVEYRTGSKALAGADVTAHKNGYKMIVRQGGQWVYGWGGAQYKNFEFHSPTYTLNQPTGHQIALSLTPNVSPLSSYSELEVKLKDLLPKPCVADLEIKKEVVDQVGNANKDSGVDGWEFKMDSWPSEFSFQSGSNASATTDNEGVAQWNFKTESPNANGTVDITEIVRSDTGAKLQNVVCRDGDNKEIQVNHEGQKFTIKLEAGGRYSCKVTNQIPGFEVEKTAAADQNPDIPGDQPVAVVDAQGNFTVRYQIKITNLSDSKNTLNKPIIDKPMFPNGFTVVNADFNMKDGRDVGVKRSGNTWELTLIDGRETFNKGGASKYINVVITGKANDAAQQSINNGTYENCEAGGGLRNQVSMDGDLDKTNNEACVDVTIEDILLKLLKVDHNDVSQALGGAQFTLFRANGDQIGEQVAVLDSGSQDDGSHSTRVELGAEYFIVETRAPENYSLLPAPIRISVNAGENGIEVKVLNPDEAFSATPKVSEEPGVAILQVADLQSGALPKSGGMGVVPFAIVALLILGLGVFMLRRRM